MKSKSALINFLPRRIAILTFLALVVMASTAPADEIISATFVSVGYRQPLDGTQVDLDVNLPGGNWMWGQGWNWGAPYVSATWDPPGVPLNIAPLGEEKTSLGLSFSSAGSYTKPTQFNISADFMVSGSGGGLGFWSSSTVWGQDDGGSSMTGFTGLILNPGNGSDGTISLVEDGTLAGTPFDLGVQLDTGTIYKLSYNVNTTDGSISNITFNSTTPVTGITSSAFTDTATAYTGLMSARQGRNSAADFDVSSLSVPEPGTYALLLGGAGMLLGFRRMKPRRA